MQFGRVGAQTAVSHHIDLDAEQLARFSSERHNRKKTGAGRAEYQNVQVAAKTIGAASRRAEDPDVAEPIAASEA